MTSPNQTEIVADHVDDAREQGARILTGGKRKDQPGDWYEPTADRGRRPLDEGDARGDVRPGDPRDEGARYGRGGPDGQRHHLRARRHGLRGRRRERRADRAPNRSRAPLRSTTCSRPTIRFSASRWAAGRAPGSATATAPIGIRKFCRSESITVPRLRQPKREFLWFPYSARQRGFVRRLYRLLNARGLRNRLGI